MEIQPIKYNRSNSEELMAAISVRDIFNYLDKDLDAFKTATGLDNNNIVFNGEKTCTIDISELPADKQLELIAVKKQLKKQLYSRA